MTNKPQKGSKDIKLPMSGTTNQQSGIIRLNSTIQQEGRNTVRSGSNTQSDKG